MSRFAWPILTVAALLFAACTSTAAPGVPSPTAPIDLTATITTAPPGPLETPIPAALTKALVTRAVAADTIPADIAAQEFPVRNITTNTPHTPTPPHPPPRPHP